MKIPDAIFNQHIAVLGKTRSGKSYTLRGFIERLLDAGHRVCIIDPKGDHFGIKSSADSKQPGYPLIIFGGEHADVPINEHVGGQVAELIATGNRPCVIDFGGWMVGERTRFWIDFASGLFRHNRVPIWLIIDEVHNFAPKGKIMDPQAGKSLHWTNRLASEGAGKGIHLIIASQRPQKVHNDTLTSCETLIAKRVIHPSDRKAIAEWIDGCGDPKEGAEVLATLAQMDRTEGWVWSPEIGFGPKRLTFPEIKTFDSFKEPGHGKATKTPKGWADVDLKEVTESLASVVKEAEANDPGKLKRRIIDLEKQLHRGAAVAQPKVEPDGRAIESAVQKAVRERDRAWKASMQEAHKIAMDYRSRIGKVSTLVGNISTLVNGIADLHPLEAPAAWSEIPATRPGPMIPERTPDRTAPDYRRVQAAQDGDLSRLKRALLTALAQHPHGLTKPQICIYANYAPAGPVSKAFADFNDGGWTTQHGSLVRITDAGLDALGPFEELPTGAALRERMLNDGSALERALLGVLFDCYPDVLPKGEVITRSSYQPAGPVSKAFAKFNRLQWIVSENGGIRVSDELFR